MHVSAKILALSFALVSAVSPSLAIDIDFLTYIQAKYPGKVTGITLSGNGFTITYDASATTSDINAIDQERVGWMKPLMNGGNIPSNYIMAGNGTPGMLPRLMVTGDLPSGLGATNINDSWTTVNGVLGNFKWIEPFQGAYKKVVIQVNGYTQLASRTITFPTPFLATPYVSSNSSLLNLTSLTANDATIPLSASAISGNIVIEGR